MRPKTPTSWLVALAPLLLALTQQPHDQRTAADHPAAPVTDASMAAYSLELLDVAFQAASAMPVNPHIKNRSRAQSQVVAACLLLDQPVRALRCIEEIDDWLRGEGYADYAFYCARHNAPAVDVQRSLDAAMRISENAEDWRRDVIRVKIARTHALLGDQQQALALQAGVVDAESGKVAAVLAERVDAASFESQFSALKEILAGRNFDQIRNALDACVVLFDRFFDDQERRDAVVKAIKDALERNVMPVRIDVLSAMAEAAIAHGDQVKALQLIGDAQYLVDHHQWETDDQVALMGKMAGLRAMAGDLQGARSEAQTAMALFDGQRTMIVDIDRADALRPVAEAYVALQDKPAAMAVYKRAMAEGAANPNARPRAQDLVATCCSLAVRSVEPDADLWKMIRQTREGLRDPW